MCAARALAVAVAAARWRAGARGAGCHDLELVAAALLARAERCPSGYVCGARRLLPPADRRQRPRRRASGKQEAGRGRAARPTSASPRTAPTASAATPPAATPASACNLPDNVGTCVAVARGEAPVHGGCAQQPAGELRHQRAVRRRRAVPALRRHHRLRRRELRQGEQHVLPRGALRRARILRARAAPACRARRSCAGPTARPARIAAPTPTTAWRPTCAATARAARSATACPAATPANASPASASTASVATRPCSEQCMACDISAVARDVRAGGGRQPARRARRLRRRRNELRRTVHRRQRHRVQLPGRRDRLPERHVHERRRERDPDRGRRLRRRGCLRRGRHHRVRHLHVRRGRRLRHDLRGRLRLRGRVSSARAVPARRKGAAAAPCTATSQCAAGLTCKDGVCCESACADACRACNLPGQAGHCVVVASADDPDSCPGRHAHLRRGRRLQAQGPADLHVGGRLRGRRVHDLLSRRGRRLVRRPRRDRRQRQGEADLRRRRRGLGDQQHRLLRRGRHQQATSTPARPAWFTTPGPCGVQFDYDCDGTMAAQYPAVGHMRPDDVQRRVRRGDSLRRDGRFPGLRCRRCPAVCALPAPQAQGCR